MRQPIKPLFPLNLSRSFSPDKQIQRWKHEAVIERHQQRMGQKSGIMKKRGAMSGKYCKAARCKGVHGSELSTVSCMRGLCLPLV